MLIPFEDLPVVVQAILVLSSVVTLALGGIFVWRIVQTVFKRDSRGPE